MSCLNGDFKQVAFFLVHRFLVGERMCRCYWDFNGGFPYLSTFPYFMRKMRGRLNTIYLDIYSVIRVLVGWDGGYRSSG